MMDVIKTESIERRAHAHRNTTEMTVSATRTRVIVNGVPRNDRVHVELRSRGPANRSTHSLPLESYEEAEALRDLLTQVLATDLS